MISINESQPMSLQQLPILYSISCVSEPENSKYIQSPAERDTGQSKGIGPKRDSRSGRYVVLWCSRLACSCAEGRARARAKLTPRHQETCTESSKNTATYALGALVRPPPLLVLGTVCSCLHRADWPRAQPLGQEAVRPYALRACLLSAHLCRFSASPTRAS